MAHTHAADPLHLFHKSVPERKEAIPNVNYVSGTDYRKITFLQNTQIQQQHPFC
jgi:hypothetical protein